MFYESEKELVRYARSLSVDATESIFLGYILDLVNDLLYLITMILFVRISRPALLWLVPAALWFILTTYLKYVMWQLNS
jgi:tryptophan-rich sensory protein